MKDGNDLAAEVLDGSIAITALDNDDLMVVASIFEGTECALPPAALVAVEMERRGLFWEDAGRLCGAHGNALIGPDGCGKCYADHKRWALKHCEHSFKYDPDYCGMCGLTPAEIGA